MKTLSNNYIDKESGLIEFFTNNERLSDFKRVERVRITKQLALKVLQLNRTIIINGHVRYFSLEHVGMGVYNIKLRNNGEKETVLEK